MGSRFKIAIERSGLKRSEHISLGKSNEKETTDICLKLWNLPEEFRERVQKVLQLCYYSGAQNVLTIAKSGKFSTEELLEECKRMLDNIK